jgi:uncharacterized protein YkwD
MFKILLILFFPSLLFAQPTSSSFLEPLQKNRLSTTKLRINDTLSQAALLHARWLSSEENRRGHIEEDPKTKTVSDRVKIFNKRDPRVLAEICLQTGKKDYSVEDLVMKFKSSQTHWWIIQEYGNSESILEVGVGYLEKKNVIYLVILFGSIQ